MLRKVYHQVMLISRPAGLACSVLAGPPADAVLARLGIPVTESELALSPKRRRVRRLFNRYGILGVTLLGMLFVPTYLIAATLVSFGCSRVNVPVWQAIAITIYTGLTGALMAGLNSLGGA